MLVVARADSFRVRAVPVVQILHDVLERQPRRVLAAPIGQARADRLGVFEPGNVVAAEAAILADAAAADVAR